MNGRAMRASIAALRSWQPRFRRDECQACTRRRLRCDPANAPRGSTHSAPRTPARFSAGNDEVPVPVWVTWHLPGQTCNLPTTFLDDPLRPRARPRHLPQQSPAPRERVTAMLDQPPLVPFRVYRDGTEKSQPQLRACESGPTRAAAPCPGALPPGRHCALLQRRRNSGDDGDPFRYTEIVWVD